MRYKTDLNQKLCIIVIQNILKKTINLNINVLLKKNQPIPIYSIHDNVEQTGEFYIDEVILDKYGCDLKIVAGFYSSNSVKYLIHVLKINPSNIKYKIITIRALKPDTFKSFIEYIFDNFDHKQTKLLANSFIGNLGVRLMCRDYETAMNISIDNYNDLHLIKEQKNRKTF